MPPQASAGARPCRRARRSSAVLQQMQAEAKAKSTQAAAAHPAQDGDDEPPSSQDPRLSQLRVSTTDAQARVMKMADGGFRPAFNAQLRRRGLLRFNVCGLLKAQAVLLWHALAHNLQSML